MYKNFVLPFARDNELISGVFRLRHVIFKEWLGWDVRSVDGMETDDYDRPGAFYGITTDAGGKVVGCWRALPTTGPYLLADHFPGLIPDDGVVRDQAAWEISRFAISPDLGREERYLCGRDLLAMAQCWGKAMGCDRFMAITEPNFERFVNALGVETVRVKGPSKVGSSSAGDVMGISGWMPVTAESAQALGADELALSWIQLAEGPSLHGSRVLWIDEAA